MTTNVEAFPIEFPDGERRVVLHCRQGGFSFPLDEATTLLTELTSALSRAIDPTPLPEAEPAPPYTPPSPRVTRRSPSPTTNIEDLL